MTLESVAVSDLFLLSKAQMRRIEPYFPSSHGVPCVDDRKIISVLSLLSAMVCVGVTPRSSTPPAQDSVDDRRVISGIVHMLRSGARWRDCPAAYGPYS